MAKQYYRITFTLGLAAIALYNLASNEMLFQATKLPQYIPGRTFLPPSLQLQYLSALYYRLRLSVVNKLLRKNGGCGVSRKIITVLMIVMISLLGATTGYAADDRDLQSLLRDFDGSVGIYAKNLKTGKSVAYNQNEIFAAASTSKLVVALAVYKYLYPVVDQKTKADYDESIELMMTVSDNDSFYYLLDEMSEVMFKPLRRVVADLQLASTVIHSKDAFNQYQYSSVTTPYEMAVVFEKIFTESYLDKEKSKSLKESLANTIFNDELPRYLPQTVMHKIGQLDDYLCDVGVVDDGQNQILISVYTQTEREEEYASDFIAIVSAKLYSELKLPALL